MTRNIRTPSPQLSSAVARSRHTVGDAHAHTGVVKQFETIVIPPQLRAATGHAGVSERLSLFRVIVQPVIKYLPAPSGTIVLPIFGVGIWFGEV